MNYPMWNEAGTGVLVMQGGTVVFLEPGATGFDAAAAIAGDWHPHEDAPVSLPPEEITAAYESAIRAHVRAVAAERQYDSPESAASYVASTVPLWAAEGAAFVAWRDAVWTQANDDLAAVLAGQVDPPESPAAYIATLPAIVWPEV